MIIVNILTFLFGAAIVLGTLRSAIRTFVLPRSAPDGLTRLVFRGMRRIFDFRVRKVQSYEDRDRIMALYAPLSLLILPPVWLVLVSTGYTLMFRAIGVETWRQAFSISTSSILTLGFAINTDLDKLILAFSEACIGLILVALLISYLPTIYSAFQKREALVTLLEVRAGSPPSALEMLLRIKRIRSWDRLTELWRTWEIWFAEIEESHTSLPAIAFFRSSQPDRSWVTAAGAILDAAALIASSVDVPRDPQVDLCIRAGYIALRRICDFFGVPYNPVPKPDDPISIRRDEYDEVCHQLTAAGVPMKPDREQAWRDFVGWRVNYDTGLLALAALTMAPYAPWSSDRSLVRMSGRWSKGKRQVNSQISEPADSSPSRKQK
jgi:hypothetical protein